MSDTGPDTQDQGGFDIQGEVANLYPQVLRLVRSVCDSPAASIKAKSDAIKHYRDIVRDMRSHQAQPDTGPDVLAFLAEHAPQSAST